jgi:hypothetical protein
MFIMTTLNMHVERDTRWRTLFADTELRTGYSLEQARLVMQHNLNAWRQMCGYMKLSAVDSDTLRSVSSALPFEPQPMPSAWGLY